MKTTKGVADIVFCLDASYSMRPCFDAVKSHIDDFISGLKSDGQMSWDLRFDYIAHCSSDGLFLHKSLFCSEVHRVLYQGESGGRFFTTDMDELKNGLSSENVQGDESPLIALDFCLDFPWRDASECHRVVVLLTDEPFETGTNQSFQKEKLGQLIEKIMALKVILYIVGPKSEVFDELSAVDKSEYTPVDMSGDGLKSVNFSELLNYIGKSVSKSNLQQITTPEVSRGLFGQERWHASTEAITGS